MWCGREGWSDAPLCYREFIVALSVTNDATCTCKRRHVSILAGDGVWSGWSQWSDCSAPCYGTRNRSRVCTEPVGVGVACEGCWECSVVRQGPEGYTGSCRFRQVPHPSRKCAKTTPASPMESGRTGSRGSHVRRRVAVASRCACVRVTVRLEAEASAWESRNSNNPAWLTPAP